MLRAAMWRRFTAGRIIPPKKTLSRGQRTICALASASSVIVAQAQTAAPAPVDLLIPWLLREDGELRQIPFRQVILDATGQRVFPLNRADADDERAIKAVGVALDSVVAKMNAPESPVRDIYRINEVSSHFEEMIRSALAATPGFSCDYPRTSLNHLQRSGYPDLRLVDEKTRRVYYLDPKLYAAGSRESSFRTFYFEPKKSTNKVRDDAVHLIIGIEHEKPEAGRPWKFTRWELIDLSGFNVRLKAEFEGSNRDMYRDEAVVASGPAR